MLKKTRSLRSSLLGLITVAATAAATVLLGVGGQGTATAAPAVQVTQRGAFCTDGSRVRCSWVQNGFLTVPAGVTHVHVEVAGGAGGDGGPRPGSREHTGAGGRGTQVSADLAVTAGQHLDVVLGQRGSNGYGRSGVPGGAGAGRGGAGGGADSAGGGGGGASRISVGTVATVVAAGGGGGGGKGSPTSRGGDGEAPGPTTPTADGADGVSSQHGDSGSGGGGGGARGGRAGDPGDDGFFYSSGAYGGHAGTSTGPRLARIDPGTRSGNGEVVVTLDTTPARPDLAIALTAPEHPVVGRPFTATATVTNHGSTPVEETTNRVLLATALRFPGGVGVGEVQAIWTTGPLPPGASATRELTILPVAAGTAAIHLFTNARGPGGALADRTSTLVFPRPTR